MKIQDKVEIIQNYYIQPKELGIILLTILSSFLVGSIPLIIGLRMVTTETTIVPSEAGLWVELAK